MNIKNHVQLIGRIGLKPEVKQLDDGRKVCNLSVATNETYTDKSGVKQELTEWHNVVAFGKMAEVFETYTDKGSQVLINGKLKNRKWDDKGGVTHRTTEIICEQVTVLNHAQKPT